MPVSLQDSDVRILTPHGDGVGKGGSRRDRVMTALESVSLGKAEGSLFIPLLSEPQRGVSLATHLPAPQVPVLSLQNYNKEIWFTNHLFYGIFFLQTEH